MYSLLTFVLMCLLLPGCAKPTQNEAATVEQPAAPQPIRRPDPPKSIVPAPKPKKRIDPDTRDYGQAKSAPSDRVTPSDPSESDKAVVITACIRQALIGDEAPGIQEYEARAYETRRNSYFGPLPG